MAKKDQPRRGHPPYDPDAMGEHDVGAPESDYPREPRAAFARDVETEQWRPLALVLAAALLGVLTVFINFRLGALLLAASVMLAFFLRLLLTDQAAGILAVRRRSLDLLFLGLLAVGLTVLAVWVPRI